MSRSSLYVDICANLLDAQFAGIYHGRAAHAGDLVRVLARARAAGVSHAIVVAGSLSEARAARELCQRFAGAPSAPRLSYTCGVHPTRTMELEEVEAAAAMEGEAAAAAASPPPRLSRDAYVAALDAELSLGVASGQCVAVGECGLDFDRLDFAPRAVQERHLGLHFALAAKHGLPLLLHDRNTSGALAAALRAQAPRLRGVVHSFTGSAAEAAELLELGLFIGLNGCSLKSAANLEAARTVPLRRLMLETDAPWCEIRRTHAGHAHVRTAFPAVKKEKKDAADAAADAAGGGPCVAGRSEPAHIVQVAEVVAAVHGVGVEEVAAAASANAVALFCLDGAAPRAS